jgi:zinc and cadmium transporter
MYSSTAILFITALFAGGLAFYFPRVSGEKYKLALVFTGSYLFAITIIHILPEIFTRQSDAGITGLLILTGFFLQQGLEFLSTGVEHGHIHVHPGHAHKEPSPTWVLIALGVHALLEGSLLVPSPHQLAGSNPLFWGILIHKAPEAFALMSVLLCDMKNRTKAVIYLILFASASPAGLLLSDFMLRHGVMTDQLFTYVLALVSGNFLHISTTIVFESSLDHKFNARKMGVAIAAALLAVAAEWLFRV